MRYGMRVFSVKHRHGRSRTDQPWVNDSTSAITWFDHCAKQLVGRLLRVPIRLTDMEQAAELPKVAEIEDGMGYLRIDSVARSGRRLSLNVRYGRGADFNYSMGAEGDESLDGRAPARSYRVELLTPAGGDEALMAVETIASACPEAAVSAWLAFSSRLSRTESSDPWPRLITTQVNDTEYLAELINRAKNVEVHLKHVSRDEIGNRRRTDFRLQSLVPVNRRGKAIDWAKEDKRGVKGMLRIIGVEDDGDFDFNDGHLTLDDGDARTKVGLSDAREKFTYPVSQVQPSLTDWEQEVRTRFFRLRPDLEWS